MATYRPRMILLSKDGSQDSYLIDVSGTKNLAAEYDSTEIYLEDSYCSHEGLYYKHKSWGAWTPVAETWDSNHWDEITVSDELDSKVNSNQGASNAGKALGIANDGTVTPVPFSGDDFTGATALTDGVHGYVPAPEAGEENKFLRGDATWANPPGSKLIVKELDNVSNTSGSYSHTTTLSDVAADMKAVMLELSNPAAFLDTINITTADGSITLSCSSVAGSSTVKVGLLFIANSGAITSSEFDVLNNRLQAVENVCTATDVTIATTDWTLANGVYSYVWSNSLVQAGSLINITLRDGAENAGIDEFEFTHTTGSVTIATSSVPTASLPITINVIHTKPNGLQELSADQISSEAVTGCDTIEEALTAINDQVGTLNAKLTVNITPETGMGAVNSNHVRKILNGIVVGTFKQGSISATVNSWKTIAAFDTPPKTNQTGGTIINATDGTYAGMYRILTDGRFDIYPTVSLTNASLLFMVSYEC